MDMVDFHSHILPYADHGSSSLDVSIEQLKLAKEHGVSRIVLTPHYYPHRENPDKFLSRREKCYALLLRALSSELPEVRLGAEVLICDNIEDIPMLDQLCIGESNVLLLELPFTDFSDSHVSSVKYLKAQGYNVVLAHADRYDPDNIERLIAVGAKIQLNADSLDVLFVKKHIKRWLQSGVVYAIGSDIHGADKKAYKHFVSAVKKLGAYSAEVGSNSDKLWNLFK